MKCELRSIKKAFETQDCMLLFHSYKLVVSCYMCLSHSTGIPVCKCNVNYLYASKPSSIGLIKWDRPIVTLFFIGDCKNKNLFILGLILKFYRLPLLLLESKATWSERLFIDSTRHLFLNTKKKCIKQCMEKETETWNSPLVERYHNNDMQQDLGNAKYMEIEERYNKKS